MYKIGPEDGVVNAAGASSRGGVKVAHRGCPICLRDNVDRRPLRYGPDEWPMKQCSHCRMVYLEKAPDIAELYHALAWEKQFSAEAERRIAARGGKRRRRFRPLPRKSAVNLIAQFAAPGPVLDVGCGSGTQLAELAPQFVPCGVEISSELAREARSKIADRGAAIKNADALSGLRQFPTDYFTGVIMRSFLEHDVNPVPVLSESARVLQPDGALILKVPNYASLNRRIRGRKWCGFHFPDHVNYFTPRTLRAAVESAGLSVRRFNLFDRPPTSDNMWMIALKPTLASGSGR